MAAFSGTGVDGTYGYTPGGGVYYGAYERSDDLRSFFKAYLPEYANGQ
jgi:hypothetical protein